MLHAADMAPVYKQLWGGGMLNGKDTTGKLKLSRALESVFGWGPH